MTQAEKTLRARHLANLPDGHSYWHFNTTMASYTKCSILGEIFVMKYDAYVHLFAVISPRCRRQQVGFHGIIIVGRRRACLFTL